MTNRIVIPGHITYEIMRNGDWASCRFQADTIATLPEGRNVKSFTISGNIPKTRRRMEIRGNWGEYKSRDGVSRTVFKVSLAEEIRENTKEGITEFLQELPGIGKIIAVKIYDHLGKDTFQELDKDVTLFERMPGVHIRNVEDTEKEYLKRTIERPLREYLDKYSIKDSKIHKIFAKHSEKSLERIKRNPYAFFLDNQLISFDNAESISADEKLDSLAESRIEGVIYNFLKRNEMNGNTYARWEELRDYCLKFLSSPGDTKAVKMSVYEKVRYTLKNNMSGLVYSTQDKDGKPIFYSQAAWDAESGAAEGIKNILKSAPVRHVSFMDDIIEAEGDLGLLLSPEQEQAVEAVLNSPITIVTGGPGTGKTSFQQVLLAVFKKHNPNAVIKMAAPTGRAARRMTESSGYPSSTLHQLLEISAGDDIENQEATPVEADMLLVDEMSMVDIFLANDLFNAIQEGTKIVCIGDIYQLPSVGAGTVLKSLIESGVIPTVRFTKVFRQAGDSPIAVNSFRINNGRKNMEYDDSFRFIEEDSSEDIVKEVCVQYEAAIKKYGVDEVCVLTPYRRSTMTGVNGLNPVLKKIVNPYPSVENGANKVDGRPFYLGDKVMFTKNSGNLTNGDIGYIKRISWNRESKRQEVAIEFDGGRNEVLSGEDLDSLVLAYAMTIHKSQGAEYKACIIICDKVHKSMLRRNLTYTGITRAKLECILIGQKIEAFEHSIGVEDTNSRVSMLSELLVM